MELNWNFQSPGLGKGAGLKPNAFHRRVVTFFGTALLFLLMFLQLLIAFYPDLLSISLGFSFFHFLLES